MKKLISVICVICLICGSDNSLAANYYWVGNSGNWSDFSIHWATTSGGSTFHSQPPTTNDDVFFDGGSFIFLGSVVNVDILANCRSMDWTGAGGSPNLSGSSELNIYGSLNFILAMFVNYSGTLSFRSAAIGNTINFAGALFVSSTNLLFDGPGNWTLLSDVDLSPSGGWITINQGTLITNNSNINVWGIESWSFNDAGLVLGNSVIWCNWLWFFNP